MSTAGLQLTVTDADPSVSFTGPPDLHTTSPSPALSGILSLDWTAITGGISGTSRSAENSKVRFLLDLEAAYLTFLHSTEYTLIMMGRDGTISSSTLYMA